MPGKFSSWLKVLFEAHRIVRELEKLGLASSIVAVPREFRVRLAQVFEEYVRSLTQEERVRYGIAIPSVRLSRTVISNEELPQMIIEDEELAKIILSVLVKAHLLEY